MTARIDQKLYFEAHRVIQPIFTGGDASIDASGLLLAACVGEDALITSLVSGEVLCRIEGDGEVLTSLQITPDASYIVLCSRSLSMRIYSLQARDDSSLIEATLTKVHKPHTTPVVTATIDRTSTLLATGSTDGAVKVWDIRGGYTTHTFRGHSGIVSALKFFEVNPGLQHASSDPGHSRVHQSKSEADGFIPLNDDESKASTFRLASGGDDGQIRIWDLVKRKSVATLTSHVSVIRGLDFSSAQNALVSASRDKTFALWDARTWKMRKLVPAFEVIEDTAFVQNGRFICTGGENGHVRVWNTDSGQEVTAKQGAGSDSDTIVKLLAPTISQDLVSVHAEQTLTFYDVKALAELSDGAQINGLPLVRRVSGTHDEVIDVTYVSPHQSILALSTNSEDIRLVSVLEQEASGPQRGRNFGSDVGLLKGHEDIIICLDVDWSGCWLVSGAKDNTARLWRIDAANESFVCESVFSGHAESVGAIALPKGIPQPDSTAYCDPLANPPRFIITGSQDKTVKLWKTGTQKKAGKSSKSIYTRKAHDKDINAIAVNHTDTLFASASQDRTVKVWSIEDGEVQGILKGHKRGVWSVVFAPKTTPTIFGDESGRSSGGRGVILTGSGDKTVKIWSLSDYSCLRTFEGHTNTVLKVLWLPPFHGSSESDSGEVEPQENSYRSKSAVAVSAGSDGLVRLWDAQSGESVATLDNHTDRIWALATHPTSGTLISGGADGVITFWRDTTAASAAARASAATQRVEQEQELANHVHRGNYREAIVLALTLNHPARLLALFTGIAKKNPESGSLSGLKAVDDVIATLSDDQLFTLLLRIRDWNTNARTAPVAQRILGTVMKSYPRQRIVDLAKGKGRRGLGEVLEALRVYTDRHYKRMEELLEESYIVDFVVRGMGEEGFTEERNGDIDSPMVS